MEQDVQKEEQRTTGRAARWIFIIVIVAAVSLALWAQVFTTVETSVSVMPGTLAPDGRSTAIIRIEALNRMGFPVPFKRVSLRCECIEGGLLGAISYNADSTEAYFKAGMQEGVVEVRVTGESGTLPQSVIIYIQNPTA